jgi:hypothetical protein
MARLSKEEELRRIHARPEFHGLDEESVRAALRDGKTTPISLEVGRLMVAYVHAFDRRDGDAANITPEEVMKVTPDCCAPIEAVALKLAADLIGDAMLLATMKSLVPKMDARQQP